jgi:PGF-pre-PGF domain-containing protein
VSNILPKDNPILKYSIIVLILLLCVGTVSAANLTVGSEKTYATIGLALDAADPGDTIIVSDGTYDENLDIYTEVTIRSENGYENTIVDGGGDTVLYIHANNVTIQGFTIRDAAADYYESGIRLDEVSFCNISDNYITNTELGVHLDFSNYNTLTGNIFSFNSDQGIYLYYSDDNNLTNNTVSDNDDGIYLEDSDYNNLTNNTVNNNDEGIELEDSDYNNLTNNTVSSNDYGIWIDYSSNNTLINNVMSSNEYSNFGVEGENLREYLHDIGVSNLVDGKPIYYWINASDAEVPLDAGTVYAINSTNITVRDIELSTIDYGVTFAYTDNSTIQNVTVSNTYEGIYLFKSSFNNLDSISASYGDDTGIYLYDSCNYNTLTNNNASDNEYGIYIEGSSNNTLTNNTANSNDYYGICLEDSNDNLLLSNNANSNELYGFYLMSSDGNTLADNVASYNIYNHAEVGSVNLDSVAEPMIVISDSATGIYIRSSDNNVLTNNTANYNSGSGASVSSVTNSIVSPDSIPAPEYSCGFIVYFSENTTLTDNTAIGNGDYDFYSRYSTGTVDTLSLSDTPTQLSFENDESALGISGNDTNSNAFSGKENVNGYVTITRSTINPDDISQPDTMVFDFLYDDSGMSSSEESSVNLYMLSGSNWTEINGTSLNTIGNYVSANLSEFGTFGLFYVEDTPSSSPSRSSSRTRASVSPGQPSEIVTSTDISVKRVVGGVSADFDLSGGDDPVIGVSFNAKTDEGLVVTKVQVLNSRPSDVPASEGNSYSVMSIDVGSEGTISSGNADNIMIRFKVSKEWIEENDIDVSTIRMTRYHGEQWNDLPTYQEREEDGYLYFYSETLGFSIFSVVGDEIGSIAEQTPISAPMPEEETEPVEEDTKDSPGFGALMGIGVVSLALLVLKKE